MSYKCPNLMYFECSTDIPLLNYKQKYFCLLLVPWSTHNCQCFWHHKLIRAVSMQIDARKECSLTWVCLEQRNEYTLIHDRLWTQLKTPLARGQT